MKLLYPMFSHFFQFCISVPFTRLVRCIYINILFLNILCSLKISSISFSMCMLINTTSKWSLSSTTSKTTSSSVSFYLITTGRWPCSIVGCILILVCICLKCIGTGICSCSIRDRCIRSNNLLFG